MPLILYIRPKLGLRNTQYSSTLKLSDDYIHIASKIYQFSRFEGHFMCHPTINRELYNVLNKFNCFREEKCYYIIVNPINE